MKTKTEIQQDIITKFNTIVATDPIAARNLILKLDYSKDANLLACIALTYKDEALFLKNGNQRKIIISNKIKLAKEYIDKAFELAPNCRAVLDLKGSIYIALNDPFTAIDCYINIIENRKINQFEYNCSNSNVDFEKMVVNDAYFQLYRLFFDLKNLKLANKFLNEFKKGLAKGIATIYYPVEKFI
jgi:hypothetical protein